MSQRQMLQDMDADLHAAFVSAGMADSGVYISAGTTDEIPCSCYFDNVNMEEMGDAGLVIRPRKELTVLRAGGSLEAPVDIQPKRSDRITVDGVLYILQAKQDSDESRTRWTVTNE